MPILFKPKQKKILYTGDMIWINKKYHHLLKNLDLVITESSFLKKGGVIRKDKETGQIFGHQGIPNLMKFFVPFTKKIVLVHFGSWFYKDMKNSRLKLVNLAKKKDLDLTVGYDGLSFQI